MADLSTRPVAITRAVSPGLGACELTHLPRQPIDVAEATRQHTAYERCLVDAGYDVERLTTDRDLPDSVFVEDIAVVFDEGGVLTRPGAPARRGETPAVASALGRYRTLHAITAPGTLDGGDVLRLGRRVFVGRTRRTNNEGIRQLETILAQWGYEVQPVPVGRVLHLKSAVTTVASDTVLLNPHWVPVGVFAAYDIVTVDPDEPQAANALCAGKTVVFPAAFPKTAARLQAEGLRIAQLDVGELMKAEGAVTCCSLLVE